MLMLHHGRGWGFHPRGLTATSSTLTKPSETVVAGSKVPSALPANTRDVCVALGLVCACSCEQETVNSGIFEKIPICPSNYKIPNFDFFIWKFSKKICKFFILNFQKKCFEFFLKIFKKKSRFRNREGFFFKHP